MNRPIDIVEDAQASGVLGSEQVQPGKQRAALVLADGRAFEGFAVGAPGTRFGEVVFNTAMTGYQEVLTDPSYRSQIVVMTYPHIGNYGVQPTEGESSKPQVAGLIVRKVSRKPSHHGQVAGVHEYLAHHGLLGLEGIDTRALVRHLREHSTQAAILTSELGPERLSADEVEALAERARAWSAQADWGLGRRAGAGRPYVVEPARGAAARFTVVAYDFGIKQGILNQLAEVGCRVIVVPADFPAEAALAQQPDGIFLSNGPGDPSELDEAVATVRALLGQAPMFGICLGHQLIGQALGGTITKLRYGHRGANHPVLDKTTGRVEITSQNHGYTVEADSLPEGVEVTHVNLNDGTVEGLRHQGQAVFSVQYHPEACPGPHDTHHLFDRFLELIQRRSLA